MTRHAAAKWCLISVLSAAAPAWAVDPDPSKLAPTTDQAERAKELAGKLGDPVFRVRDEATRELKKLGRAALPILNDTLQATPDPEVRNRCETLLPAIQDADWKARLVVFLADTDGKYDHKLPGWEAFSKIAGNSADSRALFAEACQSIPNRELIQSLDLPKAELEKLVLARRMFLYNSVYRVTLNSGVRVTPKAADVVALIFAESAVTITNRNYSYAIQNLLSQPAIREALTAASGGPFRNLLAHWMDTRTNYLEQYQVMNLASQLNMKELSLVKYAERVLTNEQSPSTYRMFALTTSARVGGKDSLPLLAKAFNDKTKHTVNWFVNGERKIHEIQIRDIALVMSLLVTDQKPEDFGVEVKNRTTGLPVGLPDTMKFSYMYYAFPDDKKRDAAFAKWNELQADVKKAEKK